MRRIILATVIAAAGLAVGTTHAVSAGTQSSAGLSTGDYCDGTQAKLNVNVNGGETGDLFDILVDGNVVAEDVGPDAIGGSFPVSDGIHDVTLQFANGGSVVQQVRYGLSCGDPFVEIDSICMDGTGWVTVLAISGTVEYNFHLLVEGDLFAENIGDFGTAQEFGPFPDGSYDVLVDADGTDSFETTATVQIDCVEGTGGQAATVEVDAYCEDSGNIEIVIESFTYGELFTITIDSEEQLTDRLGREFLLSVFSGAHHVVVTNNDGDVLFDDILLTPCDGPAAAADAACATEGSGELFVKTLGGKGYTYSVSVDGQPVADWQDVSDTGGEWESLGVFPMGEHTVLIEWTDDSENQGSEEVTVNSDCTKDDAGSGAELPVGGSDTTPMMLIAGSLLLVGLGLLTARRIRTA